MILLYDNNSIVTKGTFSNNFEIWKDGFTQSKMWYFYIKRSLADCSHRRNRSRWRNETRSETRSTLPFARRIHIAGFHRNFRYTFGRESASYSPKRLTPRAPDSTQRSSHSKFDSRAKRRERTRPLPPSPISRAIGCARRRQLRCRSFFRLPTTTDYVTRIRAAAATTLGTADPRVLFRY